MTPLIQRPESIRIIRQAYSSGTLDPVDLLERFLQRCDEVEDRVQAWIIFDKDSALQQARECARRQRAGEALGPLHGIPFAVKDVIDIAGLPTRAGSRSREFSGPARADAAIVTALRAAGAIIVGKVHTTEYAFFEGPPPTRNPWDIRRTPGGSSSGSAAAVAAGMVVASLGTQTAGSVVRPAAYCGIAAFKPTSQTGSTYGVVPFAPSFDTVGWFAARVTDVADIALGLEPQRYRARPAPTQLRIGIVRDELLENASPDVMSNVEEVICKLSSAGHVVEDVRCRPGLNTLNTQHRVMLEYEIGRIYAELPGLPAGQVNQALLDAIARGGNIRLDAYARAREGIQEAQSQVWGDWSTYDAVMFPAAPGVAPLGMKTGDPSFIVPFTALAGPITTVPTGFGEEGMPLGMMVCARPYTDGDLLQASLCIAEAIEVAPVPTQA